MTRPEPTFTRSGGAPRGPPSIGRTIVVSVVFIGTVLALLWTVANPLLAAAAVALTGALAVGGRVVVRRARRRLQVRRRTGRTRQVCLLDDRVCIDV